MDKPPVKTGFPLKLKLTTSVSGAPLPLTTPQITAPNAIPSSSTPQTPLQTPGGSKLKFMMPGKLKAASAASAGPAVKKTKAGRRPKASAKLVESQKRIKEESEDEDNDTISVQAPPHKKIKLQVNRGSVAKTPALKTPNIYLKPKLKGKPPKRTLGEGYDSEASDREIDPAIEEEFVLRMMPGEDCEYLRKAIEDKKIGIGKANGGAEVSMKFLDGDGRRAAITVRKSIYAATLVDLPCIVEGMKSWDRRGWWKSADICQMLWVFARIAKEEEAKTIALPSIIDPQTYQYPHGLTAPMHYARKRRFRKRLSKTAIEAVEDAVEKLLAADATADETRFEILDPDRQGSAFSPGGSSPPEYPDDAEYSQDEDAEGEDDDQGYFPNIPENGSGHANFGDDTNGDLELDMGDLEADLLEAMGDEAAATPASTLDATPPMAIGETPAVQEEDSGDESIEDEDDEDDEDVVEEIDEEEQNRLNQIQGTREDIIELERQLASQQNSLAVQVNPILRRRLEDSIRKIKNEIQLKKSSIGEGEEGE